MSWSFAAAGSPEDVTRAIEESANNHLTDQSLQEWHDAKSALLTLVGANKAHNISLSASGHASFANNEKTYGECRVDLKSQT